MKDSRNPALSETELPSGRACITKAGCLKSSRKVLAGYLQPTREKRSPQLLNQITLALSVHLCTQVVSNPAAGTAVVLQSNASASDYTELPVSNLLRALRPHDYALIGPHLSTMERQAGEQLYKPGDNVATVFFPCGSSLVSYQVTNEDGRDVETILIGREGAVGGIVSSGHLPAYCRIVVKFGGPFATLPVSKLELAKSQSSSLRFLFARYADCMMAQMFQSTACNAIHSIEQRAAKWIVSAMDRTGDHLVPLTHDELASMLGVGRSYASRVIQMFRADGILETRRGVLMVVDRDALKARSCQCNESVKSHFDEVLRGVYPDEERLP